MTPRHHEGWLSTIHRDTSCTWLEQSVCLAFLVIGLQGATVQDPLPPSPQPFPNLLIRPKLNPGKKRHTSNHIYKQCTQSDFYLCRCDESENLSVYVYHSWRLWEMDEFSSLKSAAFSNFLRGSFYYSLCCMMKNWSETRKRTYTEWFSCNSVENWWNLRIGYVYIVNKKEWQQWWMIIVCSV